MATRAVVAAALCAVACRERPAAAPPAPVAEIPISSRSPTPVLVLPTEAEEQYRLGRHLFENGRAAEAAEHFRRAVELDPQFAQARAALAEVTPGAAGLEHAQAAQGAGLPEAEKALVDVMAAHRRGDGPQALEGARRLVTLAPGDWRAHWRLGVLAVEALRLDEAQTALEKAVALAPQAGSAWNLLAYVHSMAGRREPAVAAARRYAELAPDEPNPWDTLGEMLLRAGKLEESEASFARAVRARPAFAAGADGLALLRGLRGRWAEADAALAAALAADVRAEDRAMLQRTRSWLVAARGDLAAAVATLEAREREAPAGEPETARVLVWIDRALFALEAGHPFEAAAAADRALALLGKEGPGLVRAQALGTRGLAQVAAGRLDDAAQSLAALEALAPEHPHHPFVTSRVCDLRGLLLLARGDRAGGLAELARCPEDSSFCRLRRLRALRQAGERDGAQALGQEILATPVRDLSYLYLQAWLRRNP